MRFTRTSIEGVHVVEPEPIEDDRGFFARTWCLREFSEHGLTGTFVQENIGVSTVAGTLRGLHFQTAPHAEIKLARCTAGAVWDVAADLRPSSPTLHTWVGVELSAQQRNMLYVPEGCAHGYVSLVDGAELRYLTSAYYAPEAAIGVRYDDPALGIEWPVPINVVSDQDRKWHLIGATNDHKERS